MIESARNSVIEYDRNVGTSFENCIMGVRNCRLLVNIPDKGNIFPMNQCWLIPGNQSDSKRPAILFHICITKYRDIRTLVLQIDKKCKENSLVNLKNWF